VLSQIAAFLVETVSGFFVFLLLARFHFQWLRVPFHNSVGEFVLALTRGIVMPVRRVLPGLRGLVLATLFVAWLLRALAIWAEIFIMGGEPRGAPILAVAAVDLVRFSVYILIFAVLLQAVLSWFHTYSPLNPVLDAIARPFLRPFRRMIRPVGGFDLTPLVLLVLLQIVVIVLDYARPLAARLG
jgi:YggT family protein